LLRLIYKGEKLMAMVKVWNKNVFDYREKFRDQHIHIPAGKFIMMDSEEAHIFKGSFCVPLRDQDGNQLPEGFKMISIEKVSDEVMDMDAKKWADEHARMNEGKTVVRDEAAEAAIKRR
jgi:hypothetical protein